MRLQMLGRKLFSLMPIVLLIVLDIAQPIPVVHASPGWSSPIVIDSHIGTDLLTSSLQASNGTLWIAWQSNRNAQTTGRYDVLYKTYTNTVWSADHNLTTSGQNQSPWLVQLSNGTLGIFWAYKPGHSYEIFYTQYGSAGWTTPLQITSTNLNDTQPAAAVGPDGTVWLVWTRSNSTNPSGQYQLYYKTWKNGVLSPEVQLTNDSTQNYGPGILIAKDGMVRVVWSKEVAASPPTYQIYSKTYNGNSWSPDKQNVTSTSTDEHPSLVQDRNGTLWLFWGRLIVISTLFQYYDLFGKYSYDMGKTWSPEKDFTNNPTSGTEIDSEMPSVVQANTGVRPLWVFYASNLNKPDLDIYALQSTGIGSVHDVTVARIAASNNLGTSWIYPGGLASVGQSAFETIAVTVADIGDYVENVSLTLTATNSTSITVGTRSNLVGPGNTWTFYFYWNTTNVRPARYGLSATIAALPGETLGNMGDNTMSVKNQIHIIPLGDVDQDGSVTLTDVSVFFYDYGFTAACNCSRWNPYADVHGTGIIDIVDVGVVANNFDTFT